MSNNLSRVLRQTAGGSAIFLLGVVAVGSQPPATVATSAASNLTTSRSTGSGAIAVRPAGWTAPNDERADRVAMRVAVREVAAAAEAAAAASAAAATAAATAARQTAVRTPATKSPHLTKTGAAAPAPPASTVGAGAAAAPDANTAVSSPPGNSAGYSFGYCTWWVSHKRLIPWHANAAQWWSIARSYGFAEGSTPRVGAVMVMGYGVGGASASSGHVGYVESVNPNGTFTISEMNWWGVPGGGWGKVDYRTVTSMAGIWGFIY